MRVLRAGGVRALRVPVKSSSCAGCCWYQGSSAKSGCQPVAGGGLVGEGGMGGWTAGALLVVVAGGAASSPAADSARPIRSAQNRVPLAWFIWGWRFLRLSG